MDIFTKRIIILKLFSEFCIIDQKAVAKSNSLCYINYVLYENKFQATRKERGFCRVKIIQCITNQQQKSQNSAAVLLRAQNNSKKSTIS